MLLFLLLFALSLCVSLWSVFLCVCACVSLCIFVCVSVCCDSSAKTALTAAELRELGDSQSSPARFASVGFGGAGFGSVQLVGLLFGVHCECKKCKLCAFAAHFLHSRAKFS